VLPSQTNKLKKIALTLLYNFKLFKTMHKYILFLALSSVALLWSCKAPKLITAEEIAKVIPPEFHLNNEVLLIEDYGINLVKRGIYKRKLKLGNYKGEIQFVISEKKLKQISIETSRYMLFEQADYVLGKWETSPIPGSKAEYKPSYNRYHGYSILDRKTGTIYHNHNSYDKENLKIYFSALEAARTKN
jgi:hypothetical protein